MRAWCTTRSLVGTFINTFALVLIPVEARAQFVRGTVVDRAGAPVAGVVSTLVDSSQTVATKALTNDRGEFSIRAPRAGTYTLRSLRIGYSATVSSAFTVPAEGAYTAKIVLDDARLQLATIRVAAKQVCQIRADLAAQTFALWEQARAAVTATEINAGSRSIFATTVVYDRVFDGSSKRIKQQTISTRSGVVTQPWLTFSVDSLLKVGYVTGTKDTVVYVAPGLDMLASNAFLEGHCLRLTGSSDTALIGIAFEPVVKRKDHADIRGTLWLNRSSAELRRIEFGYTNIPDEQARVAGGEIHFARLANGGWAISRWSIQMPVLGSVARGRRYDLDNVVLVETHVTGGELSLVTTRAGARGDTLWSHPTLTMIGSVSDSTTGKAVAGARISLLGTYFAAVTNSAGEFSIAGVSPGEYTADIRSPALSRLGTASIATITFLDSTSKIAVRVATPAQVLATLCPRNAINATSGAVVGLISQGALDEPLLNVRIIAEWREISLSTAGGSIGVERPTRYVEAKSDNGGGYRLCGVPMNTPLTVRAIGARASSLPVATTVPADVGLARVELALVESAPRTATFAGVVAMDSSERALPGAEIELPGLGRTARSNARGEFRLADIPPGTHKIVARAVGYMPLETELSFSPNQTDERTLRLSRFTILDSLVTTAAERRMSSFEENRRLGLGQFFSRENLEKVRGQSMASVIRSMSGIQTLRSSRSNDLWAARSRGTQSLGGTQRADGGADAAVPSHEDSLRGARPACYTHVWIDGVQVYRGRSGDPLFNLNSINPEEIEALEYYRGAAETPPKYAVLGSTCGVLVIWLRR